MKKSVSILLSVLFLAVTLLSFTPLAFAQSQTTDVKKTQLGSTDTYYQYNASQKLLTISGNGATASFSDNGVGQPWYDWRGDSIDKVVVENGITEIGDYLLYQVRAAKIDLPDTLTKIGNYAFYGTLGVTEWNIPFGVTSIGSNAFAGCNTMTSITLPDTLKTINYNAFANCYALTDITLPYSITTLGSNTFKNCTALENVKFQSLTATIKIGNSCFLGCANLKNVAFPMNATMGVKSFGYKTTSTKYTDVSMTVFDSSSPYVYAQRQSFPFILYSDVEVECAVGYENTYTDDNINDSYTYIFTSDSDGKYNFYTRGDCDVTAVLTDKNGVQLATSDDISNSDRNICISYDLKANESYKLVVSSYKALGTYTLWIYPDAIADFSINGTATAPAAQKMQTVDDNLLKNFVLTINFENGLSDKVFYSPDFFNATYLKQHPTKLTCGVNDAQLEIGSVTAKYKLTVTHTYSSKYVNYTEDTDGYNLYSCVLCDDSYKADFVATPAIKITGRAVMAEDKHGNHPHNVPYKYTKIIVDDVKSVNDRYYTVADDGTWCINTFNAVNITFVNENGADVKFSYRVDGLEPYTVVNYGDVAFCGYDFDKNGYCNGKDFAYFLHEKQKDCGEDYIQFFPNFLGGKNFKN